ncbi:MAG TPA: patatin-like phospholipase family protein [Thermoanaerobaculia bacterium]|nr:patatin-like phospholipase family protein [Thermoanaerobaculia bacterium]
MDSELPEGGPGSNRGRPPRVGLALACGAPEGAVYEIGALRALDEALDGVDFNDLDIYVGVSGGAVLAACLANRITTAQLCRSLLGAAGAGGAPPGETPFVADAFLRPALRDLARGALALPRLLAESVWDYVTHPGEYSFLGSLTRLSRALPAGVLDNEPIREYLADLFSRDGRTDDFRLLAKPLVVVAADLDSARAVRFGEPGMDHVPISQAVQASSALPGLYPPVEIEGRHYVDGVLLKTLHASVALERGTELLLCINPIVPVDTANAVERGFLARGKLLDRGLPAVLSQTLRTIIHSRMATGMAAYEKKYQDADVVLFEPERDDYLMFFTNVFSYSERQAICEHAYHATRKNLLARRGELAPILARHGVSLRIDVLEDPARDLWTGVGLSPEGKARPESGRAVARRLDDALGRLDGLLAAQRLS